MQIVVYKLIFVLFIISISCVSWSNPTAWTCTIRTGSDGVTSTASCVGNEITFQGGCINDTSGAAARPLGSIPTGQGWQCVYNSGNGTGTAYAQCCL